MHTRIRTYTAVALSLVLLGGFGLVCFPVCSWAQNVSVSASSGSVAAGNLSSTSSQMSSSTNSAITATGLPSLDHGVSATGVGNVSAVMIGIIQQGDGAVTRIMDRVQQGNHSAVPDLISRVNYMHKSSASGIIDKFNVSLHYHSTIEDYQTPEPWFLIQ